MKKLILFLFVSIFTLTAPAYAQQNEEILRAMQDEMKRSVSNLKMDNFSKPYFITYKVIPSEVNLFSANMGSLVEERKSASISAGVSLRVGSHKDDNSFFNGYIYSSSNKQYPSLGYDGLRAGLWEETNNAYKNALNQLTKKQAYKKNKNIAENYGDFSEAKTASDIQDITPPVIDTQYWKDLAKALSAQGNLKELDTFRASVVVSFQPVYFLSSEGAKYLKDNYNIRIVLSAGAKTKDGFALRETKQLVYVSFKDVPSREKLIEKAKDFAKETAALTKAQKAEPFIGPVMLEKGAATVLFNNVFVNAVNNPKPVYYEASDNPMQGEFVEKLGLKIMPVDFDVIEDPTLSDFNGTKLAGAYNIDDEGVKAQKLHIIKAGKLTALPTTRSLIKDQKVSNGHAKLSGEDDLFAQGRVSSLLFLPHNTIPEADFKTKFLEYCQSEGLEYCYIIRSSLASTGFSAYKVDAKTGKETPVYGATMAGISTRTLRDIKYAADDLDVYNMLNYTSIVSPSVILTEGEIKPTKKLPERLPLVARP